MDAYAKLAKLKNNSGSFLETVNENIVSADQRTGQIPGVKLLEDFTEEGRNQIAIIKGDLNNLGNYFKNIKELDELKKSSKAINKIFDEISQENEIDFFTLYAAGDDIFIISKVKAIPKALGFIKEKVSDINKGLDEIFPTQEDTLITVGVGVLTTDYRSTFRYYLEKVEQLESEAKADKSKNYFNINGMIIDEEGLTDFFQTVDLETVNSSDLKQSTSMLHNILEIAKEVNQDSPNDLKLKIREMQYILTKESVETNLQKKIFNKLNNIDNDVALNEFIKQLKNIILFVKYQVVSSDNITDEIQINEIPEVAKVFDEKTVTNIQNFVKIKLNCKIYNQKEPIKSRGFWFKLESLLSNTVENESKVENGEYIINEVRNDKLKKFLANYQYQNKKIISWKFSDESSEEAYCKGNQTADGDRRTKIRNYMNFEDLDSIQKRDDYIKSIIKDMEENKDQWRIKCREEIIKLNIEKRNGVKKNGKN